MEKQADSANKWYEQTTDSALIRTLGLVRRRRILIWCCTLIAGLIGVMIVVVSDPVYRAEVLVSPNEVEEPGQMLDGLGPLGALAGVVAGVSIGSGAESNLAIATLKSRAFTMKFIEENKLLPVLFDDKWDAANGEWRHPAWKSALGFEPQAPTLLDGFERFDQMRQISEESTTGLIRLLVDWKDPEVAADWANALIAMTNERLRRRAISESERKLDYLQEQLEVSNTVGVQQAIYDIIEREMKKAMMANVQKDYAFVVLDPALPPEEKIFPMTVLSVGLSLILGFAFGLVLGYFLDLFAIEKRAVSMGGA